MSLARPDWVAEVREEKPIVRFWPTAKRAAPGRLSGAGGVVEKNYKVVGAAIAAAHEFCNIF